MIHIIKTFCDSVWESQNICFCFFFQFIFRLDPTLADAVRARFLDAVDARPLDARPLIPVPLRLWLRPLDVRPLIPVPLRLWLRPLELLPAVPLKLAAVPLHPPAVLWRPLWRRPLWRRPLWRRPLWRRLPLLEGVPDAYFHPLVATGVPIAYFWKLILGCCG